MPPTSQTLTTLALVNGTAGGIVLVLPIIGLQAGSLMIPVLVIIAALCSFYTATLMFDHLGKAKSINQAIKAHFTNEKFNLFYNLVMFLSFFGEMILYFDLLVEEVDGLCYFVGQQVKTYFPYYVAVFLVVLTLVTKFYNFQDTLLGYGIVSMLLYAAFIIWSIATRTPGPNSLPLFNSSFIDLAASMSQGFSIHNMMIPIILRSQSPQNYKKILMNVFISAAMLYTLIAYGSIALVNKKVMTGTGEIVEDYFVGNQWEVFVLRIIFIVNIVTVFPQFVDISRYLFPYQRMRFFGLFTSVNQQAEEEQNRSNVLINVNSIYDNRNTLTSFLPLKEIVYCLGVILVCLLTKILKLRAPLIIELNGSIICFIQIYLIPVALHIQCLYFNYHRHRQVQKSPLVPKAVQNVQQLKEKQLQLKSQSNDINCQQQSFKPHNSLQPKDPNNKLPTRQHTQSIQPHEQHIISDIICQHRNQSDHTHQTVDCSCLNEYLDKENNNRRYNQIGIALLVLGYGMFVMVYTLFGLFCGKEK